MFWKVYVKMYFKGILRYYKFKFLIKYVFFDYLFCLDIYLYFIFWYLCKGIMKFGMCV